MKLALFILYFFAAPMVLAGPGDLIRSLPVQDAGRIKPFDTFAQETLELVHGKKTYKVPNSDRKVEAQWVVLTWMLSPESWLGQPVFQITNHEVLDKLGLPKDRKVFSGDEIFKSEKFANLMQELADKRETKEKLTPYFQALQRLENQFGIFREIASGKMLKVIPPKPSENSTTWVSVADLPSDLQPAFVEISKNVAQFLGSQVEGKNSDELGKKLDESVIKFEDLARAVNPIVYDQTRKVSAEVFYNDLHPFRWAYAFYFLSVLSLLVIWIRKTKKGMWIPWVFIGVGFLLHTLGFVFRVYLAERPPVSNMYETVIWASWGAVLFSMILEAFYRFRIILMAGALVGLFALVVADSAPAVLDPSLQPLEAVLRSNYWLIIHVMTITISYAAFLLAMGLGDLALVYYTLGEKKTQRSDQSFNDGCVPSHANRRCFSGAWNYFRRSLGR